LIFSRLWPAPLEGEVRTLFSRALSELARMARLPSHQRIQALGHTAAVESLVGKCDEALCLLPFEPKWLRPPPKREAALKKAID
ncbi:TPA: hypothetical protein ACMDND_003416, partial [Vibrio metschnikovii]